MQMRLERVFIAVPGHCSVYIRSKFAQCPGIHNHLMSDHEKLYIRVRNSCSLKENECSFRKTLATWYERMVFIQNTPSSEWH